LVQDAGLGGGGGRGHKWVVRTGMGGVTSSEAGLSFYPCPVASARTQGAGLEERVGLYIPPLCSNKHPLSQERYRGSALGSALSQERYRGSALSQERYRGSALSQERGSALSQERYRGSALSQERYRGSALSQERYRGSALSQERYRGSALSQERYRGSALSQERYRESKKIPHFSHGSN
uniref:Uncharacterized protein n=1 Tax=Anolis carolinensis TaxID=28377 RepID=A0A803TWY5_ANOCA